MPIVDNILNIVAPHDCISCGKEGSVLCDTCILGACPPIPSRCYRCKKLTHDFAVCSSCRKVSKLQNVWVRTEYSGIAKKLIYQLKFRSSRSVAKTIAQLLADFLPVLPSGTIVVHAPTASSRRRQRSFDHSQLIAKSLANGLGLDYEDAIGRVGQTRQVGTGREDRLKQLKESFYVKSEVSGVTILLVDDIVTTGGTLESAAEVLRQVGAKKIYAVTLAQK